MNPTSIDTLSMFSKSCGAGSLHLNFLEADGSVGEHRSFNPPFYVVGRSPDADLRLDHDEVSWRHCYLQVIGGRLVSIDLDSQSGVLIDGVPQRIGWVTPANRLQIGPVSFHLEGGEGEGGDRGEGSRVHPLSAQYARNLPPAIWEIEGAVGPAYGWRMSRALTLIGRSTACQVRLMNPSVSTFHAALVRTPEGIWIVDLLSREGIEVDGSNVRFARLEEGMVCQVGSFTLRLCSGTVAPAPPRRPDRHRALPAPSVPQAANASARSLSSPERRSVLLATPAGGGGPGPATPNRSSNLRGNHEPDHRPSWNPEDPGFESSQQAMMMLAQMLGTMHSDHMKLVKDELSEIRKLAEEMHALRVEIGRRPAEPVAPAAQQPAVGSAPVAGTASPDVARSANTAAGGNAARGVDEEAVGAATPRDPRECLAIASQFLASYERKQEGHWARILRIVTGISRGQEPGRGPLEQAPLG